MKQLHLSSTFRTLLLGLTLLGSSALGAQTGDNIFKEEGLLPGSQLVDGPVFLTEGSLDISYFDPTFGDGQFTAAAEPIKGFPGSLLLPETPFGQMVVFDTGNPSTPEYILGLLDVGVSTPLTPGAHFERFLGVIGSTFIEVSQGAVVQGPHGGPSVSGGGRVNGIPGWDIFRISSPCLGARFRQFVTLTVEWKGTRMGPNGPVDVSGSGGSISPISGNNGQDVNWDGGTTYVDSARSVTGGNTPAGYNPTNDGDYPAFNSGGSTHMTDAPNVPNNPAGIVNDIQNANPGVTVTEIKTTMRFTTYVICNGWITHKIKWTHVETVTAPFAGTGYGPNGGFGGPDAGPGQPPFTGGGLPSVEPATGMEPHHAQAHGNYMAGNYGGAPNGGAQY